VEGKGHDTTARDLPRIVISVNQNEDEELCYLVSHHRIEPIPPSLYILVKKYMKHNHIPISSVSQRPSKAS
jgi:hypothetical protein